MAFLFLHLAQQLRYLQVLAFSATSFHSSRCWINVVQWLLFIIQYLNLLFVQFSQIIVGLPADLVDIGFHLYNGLTILSFFNLVYMAKPA